MLRKLKNWIRDVRLTWWDLRNPDPPAPRRCCHTGRCGDCPESDAIAALGRYLQTQHLGKTEEAPVIRGPFHCVNCGHRGTCLIPTGAVSQEMEDEILDMLQCPVCGLYTMCSD